MPLHNAMPSAADAAAWRVRLVTASHRRQRHVLRAILILLQRTPTKSVA